MPPLSIFSPVRTPQRRCAIGLAMMVSAACAAGTVTAAAEPVIAPDMAPGAVDGCVLTPAQVRTVTAIVEADTLTLDDGSMFKLAGVLSPRMLDTPAAVAIWPPQSAALAALSDLVLGRTVALHPTSPRTDRYGRRTGHAFVERDGERVWVQGALLSAGHARVHLLGDGEPCADALFAHERTARRAKAGLWANPAYFERAAYRTRELMRLRSTYQIVGGRVRKVAEMKSAIYLNFGTSWQSDFTVGFRTGGFKTGGIKTGDIKTGGIKTGKGPLAAPEFRAMVRALEGRRVRVRGWIDRRNGPYIEIAHPAEIEVVDEATIATGGAQDRDNHEKRPEP